MLKKFYSTIAVTALLAACGQSSDTTDTIDTTDTAPVTKAVDIDPPAVRIAKTSIVVDTHIDVPYRLDAHFEDVSVATQTGDFDYPRAVSGGLDAPFMSIYTPAELEAEGGSKRAAERLIAMVENMVERSPDKFTIARTTAEVRENFAAGIMSLPLGMENGSPIEGDLENLQYFYECGIRYITLTHSLSNHISDSSYDDNHQWEGLSEFGTEVVREMNRLGIMIDVSHVSDDAFWQAVDLSTAPLIASHSSARHFTPGFERNMNDEMIIALAENGGVIQINFGSSFLTAAAQEYSSARRDAQEIYHSQHPDLTESELDDAFPAIYAEDNGPFPFASLDDVLDHFDHVVSLTSIDHVGIGSDYDGVGDSLPTGLKDVASYPNLIEGLLKRGYSEADIQKVLGENLLRVWEAVEDHAGQSHRDQAATTSSST